MKFLLDLQMKKYDIFMTNYFSNTKISYIRLEIEKSLRIAYKRI